ncbi:cytochrome b/b6 domain-containing protein [Mesorhizobium sp. ESP6-5]|uniref:cytochrome b/b6 domain-containing protein n=1 Tax=unclassified Mesorhizobium TaxID=325217 RepID=UPI001125CFA7|nr:MULTISPECIES: cytochrome b/b6 domain-containing protein [unclassified Mesorhizobium]MBZ9757533.1 cytochrome b/b6 domain-containing protein [Mesorhizobium sp. ESP6-5]TPL64921.1 cytochrome B [Mesorhizobium sp. B2-3-15]
MNATVSTRETSAESTREASVEVWSPYVRLFHWSLVLCVAVAWLSSGEIMKVHELAGYSAGVLIASRLIAGLAGSGYTRFRQFVRGPRVVSSYLADVAHGDEKRYLGHNPAGGAMVLALLACVAGIALTGWMQTTDAWWGVAWVEDTHKILGNGVLVLIGLHVGGVLLASLRHHENLVRAMITGRKRAASPQDVG